MKPLKIATATKHRMAEKMPFNQRMINGMLTPAEYLLYLIQQEAIFTQLEKHPLPHYDLPRALRIRKDVEELLLQGYKLPTVLKATQSYIEHLDSLDHQQRLAHVYLNYLAVMFGGHMLKQVVPSSGKFYEFEDMHGALLAVRAIQKDEWAEDVNKGFDFHIHIFKELEIKIRMGIF